MSDHGDLLAQLMTDPAAGQATPPPPKPKKSGESTFLSSLGARMQGHAPPPVAAPRPYVQPPGWNLAPVHADAPQTYQIPSGWTVPGAPPPDTSGQANATSTYVPPPGWAPPGQAPSPVVANVQAAQAQDLNAATQAALQARFGGGRT